MGERGELEYTELFIHSVQGHHNLGEIDSQTYRIYCKVKGGWIGGQANNEHEKKYCSIVHTCAWCSSFLLACSFRLSTSIFNCFTSLPDASNFNYSSSRESYNGNKY